MAAKNASCNCSPTERLDKRLLRETWGLMPKPANPHTREYWYIYLWGSYLRKEELSCHTQALSEEGPCPGEPCSQGKGPESLFYRTWVISQVQAIPAALQVITLCHSTFNFSTDLNKDKQSLSSCTRTGSLYNTPQRLLLNYGFCWLFGIPFWQPSPERCWVPPQGAKHPPRI